MQKDYRTVNEIAAERSFTPSSSHLDCGAVAPAIIAFTNASSLDINNHENDKYITSFPSKSLLKNCIPDARTQPISFEPNT